jgi:hypothetical protein
VPQIRFSPPEPASDAVVARASAPAAAGSFSNHPSSSFSPSSAPASSYHRAEENVLAPHASGSLDRQAAVRSALNAGVMAGVVSLLPVGFFLAPVAAGFLCVLLYRRRSSVSELSTGAGFRLGMLCGGFGFAFFAVLATVLTLASRAQNEFQDRMIEAVRHAQANYPDPQARQLDYFLSPHGMVVLLVVCGVFSCVVFVLLAGIGGVISASRGRRKN